MVKEIVQANNNKKPLPSIRRAELCRIEIYAQRIHKAEADVTGANREIQREREREQQQHLLIIKSLFKCDLFVKALMTMSMCVCVRVCVSECFLNRPSWVVNRTAAMYGWLPVTWHPNRLLHLVRVHNCGIFNAHGCVPLGIRCA